MFKSCILFVSLIILSNNAYSQLVADIVDPNQLNKSLLYKSKGSFEGTPFLFEDWVSADLHSVSGKVFTNQKLNYDVLNNQLLILDQGSNQEFVIEHSYITSFQISSSSLGIVNEVSRFENIDKKFLEVLYTGENVKLLKSISKKLKKASPTTMNGYGVEPIDKIEETEEFFMKIKNSLYSVPKSKNKLLNEFPQYEKEISYYFKHEKINLKKQVDIIKLAQYMDTLKYSE